MLNFTRQERFVIYFLVVTLGIGAILKLVRDKRLETQLNPERFYKEEQVFKRIAQQINSNEKPLIDNNDSVGLIADESSASDPAQSMLELININTADVNKLSELPGIGPAIAKRIRAYTDQNGPFKNKKDIVLVKGIGKKIYARIEGLVTTE